MSTQDFDRWLHKAFLNLETARSKKSGGAYSECGLQSRIAVESFLKALYTAKCGDDAETCSIEDLMKGLNLPSDIASNVKKASDKTPDHRDVKSGDLEDFAFAEDKLKAAESVAEWVCQELDWFKNK